MRGTMLLDQMELVDPAYVEAADAAPEQRRRRPRLWRVAAAACLCLLLAGPAAFFFAGRGNRVQNWSEGFPAEHYFRYCSRPEAEAQTVDCKLAEDAYPYTETRFFSDWRSQLEEKGAIPVLENHPLFYLTAHYYSDGSLYSVELSWHRRDPQDAGGLDSYSDLTVLAGYEEIPIIEDCIDMRAQRAVTVTEREGISIVAQGLEDTKKTLTYQTEHGWYQLSGSGFDSYESVVELLDWFWQHPLDLSQFPMEEGDLYTVCTLAEQPEAFAEYLPDFAGLGFVEQDTTVVLKNGTPLRFEGHYACLAGEQVDGWEAAAGAEAEEGAEAAAGVDKSAGMDEGTDVDRMHWCITKEPDFYQREACIGALGELTREQVTQALAENSNLKFWQGDCVVTVYPKDPGEAWLLIESLQHFTLPPPASAAGIRRGTLSRCGL